MDIPNEKEEIKSVSGKVLAFGMATTTLLVAIICGGLIIALFSMSSRYLHQAQLSQERQEVITTMQRALDRAEGKLAVYEEFLGNRREIIVRKMITQYLRKERMRSTDVTLSDFEKWAGIGGK